jgi:hypothetical protein
MKRICKSALLSAVLTLVPMLSGCPLTASGKDSVDSAEAPSGRLVMFLGVDISGSFMRSKNFDDSLSFAAHYLYAHLNGLGGLEVPHSLFVGSIGGASPDEAKTFYPIQTFANKSVDEINAQLHEIFPRKKENPFTDFNAFFGQIAEFVRSRNLVMRPISIVMLSDGIPDAPVVGGGKDHYKNVRLDPLENLARKITLRILYTDAVVGMNWQTKVKRQRVRVWTQDAAVMQSWQDPKIFEPQLAIAKKTRFLSWIKENVDFSVRVRRVD